MTEATPTVVTATESSIPKSPENNIYYTIRHIPSKGYGCIAIRPIPRGTRILADPPLLTVPIASYLLSDIQAAFTSLPPTKQSTYCSLASAHGQNPAHWPTKVHDSVPSYEAARITEQHSARTAPQKSLLSIFQTNCMEHGPGAAVFEHASRFNHSCAPNAFFCWNEALGCETVHTIRPVEEDEEICVGYVDGLAGRARRRWELRHYGFVCKCVVCEGAEDVGGEGGKSEERRLRAGDLERRVEWAKGLGGGVEGVAAREEVVRDLVGLVGLLRREGEWTPRLAGAYFDLALACAHKGDLKTAVKTARKAQAVARICQGEDYPDYYQYGDVIEQWEQKLAANS